MTKNKMMRIASVLLVAVLLSTCVISGTFAKYTTQVTASYSARVAKWAFEINEETLTADNTSFTFDLFSTIKESNGTDDEDDVDTTSKLIAPGTSGSFAIVLTNNSEVTAKYAITFSADLADVPLQFKTTGDWTTSITTLNISASEGTKLEMTEGTDTVTVYWKWAFDGVDTDDTDDTALGFAGTAEPTVTATVTLTQVD